MKRSVFLKRGAGLAGGALFGAGLFELAFNSPPRWVDADHVRRGLLRPPGAQQEAAFLSSCIRCERCAQVCEADCIRLFPAGSGRLTGTPYIVAEERACDLCGRCGPACPTGALAVLPGLRHPAFAAAARMGTAVVDERLCVSANGTGVCGACHRACPLKGSAITQGAHNRPTVKDGCVGCGLCEEACIVKDPKAGRAIRVRSPRSWA
ncbi:MAG: 4Fe-4S dicluster domain-containing protein [Elusimicrobia bacterium]|nr:4Fe-4S dicluster domain-containing protein [Elusimicrobiota bacterium]